MRRVGGSEVEDAVFMRDSVDPENKHCCSEARGPKFFADMCRGASSTLVPEEGRGAELQGGGPHQPASCPVGRVFAESRQPKQRQASPGGPVRRRPLGNLRSLCEKLSGAPTHTRWEKCGQQSSGPCRHVGAESSRHSAFGAGVCAHSSGKTDLHRPKRVTAREEPLRGRAGGLEREARRTQVRTTQRSGLHDP